MAFAPVRAAPENAHRDLNLEYAPGAEKNAQSLARLQDEKADVWVLSETQQGLRPPPTSYP